MKNRKAGWADGRFCPLGGWNCDLSLVKSVFCTHFCTHGFSGYVRRYDCPTSLPHGHIHAPLLLIGFWSNVVVVFWSNHVVVFWPNHVVIFWPNHVVTFWVRGNQKLDCILTNFWSACGQLLDLPARKKLARWSKLATAGPFVIRTHFP
jgi:hypothetical protein